MRTTLVLNIIIILLASFLFGGILSWVRKKPLENIPPKSTPPESKAHKTMPPGYSLVYNAKGLYSFRHDITGFVAGDEIEPSKIKKEAIKEAWQLYKFKLTHKPKKPEKWFSCDP